MLERARADVCESNGTAYEEEVTRHELWFAAGSRGMASPAAGLKSNATKVDDSSHAKPCL